MARLYPVLGGLLLVAFLWAEWMGWAPTPTDRLHNVPASVRNNPGSYRAHYQQHYYHIGGK